MTSLLLLCLATADVPAAETVAAPSARPNILFCISDDQSYPHCSAYGCDWVYTPAFDRVAAEGLLFNKCYTPNAKCAPSRAIVLTGQNSWELGAAANHVALFPPEQAVYVDHLAAAGYACGMTGKGWAPGVALHADGSPRSLTGQPFSKRRAEPPTTKISKNDYAGNFADFLDAVPSGDPFCFWYGGTEPHRAYQYGSGAELGDKSPLDIDRVPGYWPDSPTVRNDMLDYALEIEHFDRHLGRMLDELEKRGQLANTLVVITSDNGMPFPRVKGQTYERSHHMPLAIMWPAGIESPGRTIDDFVSFVDFAPTFLDVAGVAMPAGEVPPLQNGSAVTPTGRSLRPIFESTQEGRIEPDRDGVILGKERHDLGRPNDGGYPSRGLVTEKWLFTRNALPDRWPAGNPETGYMNTDGGPTKTQILNLRRDAVDRRYWDACFGRRPAIELYDLTTDPDCLVNLAAIPGYADTVSDLSSRLTQVLVSQNDPRETGEWPEGITDFEDYPYSKPEMAGYYEKFTTGWTDDRGRGVRAGWIEQTDIETDPVE